MVSAERPLASVDAPEDDDVLTGAEMGEMETAMRFGLRLVQSASVGDGEELRGGGTAAAEGGPDALGAALTIAEEAAADAAAAERAVGVE